MSSDMEFSLLNKSALRVKSKHASFVINPQDATNANAALLLNDSLIPMSSDETVFFQGAGEYEVGGIKITGTRHEDATVYSLSIEGVLVLIGSLPVLSSLQQKMKEHNIVVALCDEPSSASFITSLTTNVVLFYGSASNEVAEGFEKEKLQHMNKYSISAGKLPTEVETIVLQ